MKTRLLLCVAMLFCTGCGATVGSQPTVTAPSPSATLSPISPTRLPEPTATYPSPTATSTASPTASPAAAGCVPSLTPAAFFSDGDRLLGMKDRSVQIYNLKTHQLETSIPAPGRVIKAALAPDGQTLARALEEDFSIQLVRLSDRQVLHTLKAHTGIISGLEFSPSGDSLLTASEDTWVRTWSLDGQEVGAFQPSGADDFPSEVMGIGLSSDWKELATIPFNGSMKLWSLPGHKLLGTFEGTIQGGYSGSQAAFSPDGQYLAQHLGAGGGSLSLWRIADGKLLLRGENLTTGAAFSPDGSRLAYGEVLTDGGGHLVVRSPDGSRLFYELKGPVGSLPGVPLFSPDGRLLAAVDYISGALLAWTMADGQPLRLGEAACP